MIKKCGLDTNFLTPISLMKPRFSRGFTLVEILIIVAIVGIIATTSVVSFQKGQQDEALRIVAMRVGEGLRRAQNLAQTGTHAEYPTAESFGMYIKKPDIALVFADNKKGATIGVWEQGKDDLIGEPLSFDVGSHKNIELMAEGGISFDGVSVDEAHLAFRVPQASGLINGKSDVSDVVVTVKDTKSGHIRRVTFNRITGRVDVEY